MRHDGLNISVPKCLGFVHNSPDKKNKKNKPDTMLRAVMVCINKTNTSNRL